MEHLKYWSMNYTPSKTNKNHINKLIQKINSFNKIHVKHQNTEMAKKKKITLVFFFQFCTNHSGSKILQIFSFKTFFFSLQQQQNILIVVYFLESP